MKPEIGARLPPERRKRGRAWELRLQLVVVALRAAPPRRARRRLRRRPPRRAAFYFFLFFFRHIIRSFEPSNHRISGRGPTRDGCTPPADQVGRAAGRTAPAETGPGSLSVSLSGERKNTPHLTKQSTTPHLPSLGIHKTLERRRRTGGGGGTSVGRTLVSERIITGPKKVHSTGILPPPRRSQGHSTCSQEAGTG